MITLVVPPAYDDATVGIDLVLLLVSLCPIVPMAVVGAQSSGVTAMNAIWPWLLLPMSLSLRVPSLTKILVCLCLVCLAGVNAIGLSIPHLSDSLLWAWTLAVGLARLSFAHAAVRPTRNRNDH